MKNLLIFLLLFITTIGYSQSLTIEVKNVQNFTHPNTLQTNEAIEKDKIVYGDYGTTNTIYKFDFKNNLMYRKMDDRSWEKYTIIDHEKIDATYNITILYPLEGNIIKLNFTLSTLDNNFDIIQCRYHWNDEIVGWFDREVKIKRGL